MPPGFLLSFSQIILAGGDCDVTAAELIDWVLPVLAGLPDQMWFGCEITAASQGCLTARVRSGLSPAHLALCSTIPRARARLLRKLFPSRPPVAVILLNEHAPQVMTLLDGMASWLSHFEAHDPLPAPIFDMLQSLGERPGMPVSSGRAMG